MIGRTNLKTFPRYESDRDAERFVAQADLSVYDLSGFKPMRFEFDRKAARVNMRLPESMLAAVKARARARGASPTSASSARRSSRPSAGSEGEAFARLVSRHGAPYVFAVEFRRVHRVRQRQGPA
jgi:predicted DNA binding CopG/RHH family protein